MSKVKDRDTLDINTSKDISIKVYVDQEGYLCHEGISSGSAAESGLSSSPTSTSSSSSGDYVLIEGWADKESRHFGFWRKRWHCHWCSWRRYKRRF